LASMPRGCTGIGEGLPAWQLKNVQQKRAGLLPGAWRPHHARGEGRPLARRPPSAAATKSARESVFPCPHKSAPLGGLRAAASKMAGGAAERWPYFLAGARPAS
jgi:hypothetical protein